MMREVLSTSSFKDLIKKILSCAAVLFLFLWGLNGLSRLTVNKTSYTKYEQFQENGQKYDVLFFGSSHVINGISPLDLFRDYGITSYNFSMHGNYIKSSSYLLEEALRILERQKKPMPKAVVLDVYAWGEGIANLHNAWDSLELSRTKTELAETLETEERQRLLFPFSIYHSRWSELTRNDFEPSVNQWYGVELRYGVKLPAQEVIRNKEERGEVGEEKLEYLEKIRMLCEEKGIQLYLIQIPYSYYPDWQREANGIYEYAEKSGVPYINYMNEDIEIDFDIDFYDEGHLNPVGMREMTSVIGGYLSEHGLPDHRQEEIAEEWESGYEDFIQYRIQRLKDTKELTVFLMGLNDPDLYAEIQIQEEYLEDLQIGKLVQRLSEKGDRVTVLKEPVVIVKENGEETYHIFCSVYRAQDKENRIWEKGFTWTGNWQ